MKEAGLPNITGNSGAYLRNQIATLPTGAFGFNGSITLGTGSANVDWQKLSFNASKSNSIYGKSDTVQPNSVCVNYIIKY